MTDSQEQAIERIAARRITVLAALHSTELTRNQRELLELEFADLNDLMRKLVPHVTQDMWDALDQANRLIEESEALLKKLGDQLNDKRVRGSD